jgi:hypothetical protein
VTARAEGALAVLVLCAAGLVLAAPLAGRAGAPRLADLAMALAALCGVASFALAGAHTLRAARGAGRPSAPGREEE